MQKTIWTYLLLACSLLNFTACENELDIAADWEEVAIIYGALNPTSAKNYVRIQRAYLDEKRSAFSFSRIQDSLYFDTLDVTINEFKDGVYTKTYTLNKVNGNDLGLPKDTGIFYSDENILYELSDPVKASAATVRYDYELIVRNPISGYECRAKTISVGKPEVTEPLNDDFNFLVVSTNEDHSVLTRFLEGVNVRSYTVVMDMRIEETLIDDPSSKQIKEISWRMIHSGKTKSLRGFNRATYLVPSVNFFATLNATLTEDVNIERRLVDFDLSFYGIADDFNTYLDVNKPSIGIVQKKPEFTNVTNGLGLFSSRHIKEFKNQIFHESTIGQLQASEYTVNLGFVD
ncbi:MAG: hypothetical protein COA58_00320 [Bacteroidetes bacterium]|nr:MAG: hypothetical protein COA58_00320 [Bacteroidota bacterium]